MKGKLGSTIKYTLFLGVGVLLMYLTFKNIPLQKMLVDLKNANYYWVAFSLIFSLVALFSRAYRWGMLIESISEKPKLMNLFYALNTGYMANLAAPKLGEVTRCTVLAEVENTSFDKLVGTVIAERVVDVISLLTLIFITLFLNFKKFSDFFYNQLLKDRLTSLANASPLKLIIIVAVPLALFIFIYLIRKKIFDSAIGIKILKFLSGVSEGLKTVLKLKNRKEFIFHTVLIWAMYYTSCYVCFFSIPETSGLSLEAGMFILVLGGIAMSAPVNGGIGAYHILVAAGLTLYGIVPIVDPITGDEVSKGKVFATIVHSSQMLFLVSLGAMSLVFLNFEKRKLLKLSEKDVE